MVRLWRAWMLGALLVVAPACHRNPTPLTAADAATFLAEVNATMLRLGREQNQADWVYSTYITPDTEAMNARAERAFIEAVARYAADAAKFDTVALGPDARRQMDLLKLSLELVTPANPRQAE